MASIPRSYRRLGLLVLSLPILLFVLALIYQAGMTYLERQPRTLGQSLQWAAGTLTTTGFGPDTKWTHPAMQLLAIVTQFSGVFLVFLVFPVFVIPFLEERFEARLPADLPALRGQVLVYRYGPAVTSLLEELEHARVPAVIFEEDLETARWLRERKFQVVIGDLEQDEPDLKNLVGARGLVLNGPDEKNAALALSARSHGYKGPIIALVENPSHHPPMLRAGATTVATPEQVLAAALAARASREISPRVSGVHQLGRFLEVAELRVPAESPLAGKSVAESQIRSRTGATIVGCWHGGELTQVDLATPLGVGTILVAVGSPEGLQRLSTLATPVPREGPILIVGYGGVGQKVAELLREAGEAVHVVHEAVGEGVDTVGNALDGEVLVRAGIRGAQAAVLALETDAATLFGAAVVRHVAPDALIVAGARRAENVARIHRAGADFALSMGEVAGQLVAYHLLGQDWVSLEAGIKLVSTAAGELAGQPLATKWIREQTGCTVVAVERGDQVFLEFDRHFALQPDDIVYLSGTRHDIGAYFSQFPETRELPVAYRKASHSAASESG
jgi:Trk K+ transport system NAD-binding subunit